MTNRNMTITAPPYTSTCAAATNSPPSRRKRTASDARFPISASAEKNGLRKVTTAIALATQANAEITQTHQMMRFDIRLSSRVGLVVRDRRVVEIRVCDRNALDRRREQH